MSSAATSLIDGDRLEDHGQLRREVVELGVGQVDPGEVGQVRDLVAGDRGGSGMGHPSWATGYAGI